MALTRWFAMFFSFVSFLPFNLDCVNVYWHVLKCQENKMSLSAETQERRQSRKQWATDEGKNVPLKSRQTYTKYMILSRIQCHQINVKRLIFSSGLETVREKRSLSAHQILKSTRNDECRNVS